jgi:hypothetical protein
MPARPVRGRRRAGEAAITPLTLGLTAPTPASAGPAVPGLTDPIGNWFGRELVQGLVALLRALISDVLHQVVAPLSRYLLRTPDIGGEPTLRHVWLAALGLLLTMTAVLVMVAGVAMTTGTGNRWGSAARQILGNRVLAGLATAAVSLPLVALEVRLANVCVATLLPGGLGAHGGPLSGVLTGSSSDAAGLALLVMLLVAGVLLVVLLVLSLARWAALCVLVVLAPVAMGFGLLPGGDHVPRLWWRLQLTTVFLPLGYAAVLATYGAMFGSVRTGLVGALAGVAVLGLMAKLPRWAAGSALAMHTGDVVIPWRTPFALARQTVRDHSDAVVQTEGDA